MIGFDKDFFPRNNFLELGSERAFQKCFKQDTHKTFSIRRGIITPKRIAEILDILNDGQWHSIDEVRSKAKLNENQAKRITEFLSEYKFISVDEAEEKVRLTEDVRRFLLQKATS